MKLRRFSLSTVTAVTIAAMLVLSMIIAYSTFFAIMKQLTEIALRTLPADVAQAYRDIQDGVMPSVDSFRKLMLVVPEFERIVDAQMNWAFIGHILLAAFICGSIGYWLARRIARPLEKLVLAAETLREGDFAIGLGDFRGGTSEVQRLGKTIDALASDLDHMEKRLRFNTMAVAHELRTPLTILQGNLQGMIDGVFPVHQQGLQDLLKQVLGLSRLVEDLRTLSLAAGHKLIAARLPTDLAVEAKTVLAAARPMLEETGMRVETDFGAAPVNVDSERMRQAMLALVHNACRYAATGGVLRCETGLDKDGSAFVRFLDRGPGLLEEIRSISFDVFWRGETSRSRTTGGTGLGLSIVEAIAKAHGGRLEAGNRPGGGAAITLFAPSQSI
ncbi:ATP-binding protein [Mesorhizobium sp. 1M-11]|uniref:ATP-binding protein n=1 Tax=Mesorhizobium sp. 1M-11 TaxID=1529006 RepID=UPI0006C74CF8|nr:ATP-binding protein [Mesorhizobium sp. 1M-11]